MKTAIRVITIFLGIACYSQAYSAEPIQLESKFDADEIKWVNELGNSSIKGKAFLRLKDNKLKGCAGFGIELLPVAKYSNERIFKTYGSNNHGQILVEDNPPKFTPDVKEYHDMVIKSRCNENNEFVFNNISAGEYYVMAFIIWDESRDEKSVMTGGAAMKKVSVKANSQSKVLVKI